MSNKSFHALSIHAVLKILQSSQRGLTSSQARARLRRYGANTLPVSRPWSLLRALWSHRSDPFLWILFVAALASVAGAHYTDAVIIGVVVSISLVVSVIQEYKANSALEHLRSFVRPSAMVVRDNQPRRIGSEVLVPGDVIMLRAGDSIPADARLLGTQDLEVVEASLTGESQPQSKVSAPLGVDVPLPDRKNILYAGTTVTRGNARAVVVATGTHTELGQIAHLVGQTDETTTPLQKQLHRLAKRMSQVLVALTVGVFFLGIVNGQGWLEMFLTSVAVAVASIPEGLLPALIVILSISMKKLLARQGLVRRLLAAETLGSITVICTDKTGTLTQGEMQVVVVGSFDQEWERSSAKQPGTFPKNLESVLEGALLANNGVVENPRASVSQWKVDADTTEKAVLLLGGEFGFEKSALDRLYPRVGELPFDSSYKYMATLHRQSVQDGKLVLMIKGAPDRLVEHCQSIEINNRLQALTPLLRQKMNRQIERLTANGYRVLLLAKKTIAQTRANHSLSHRDITELCVVGWFALVDPLRPDSVRTITLCQGSGIRPIVVTGDHRLTAVSVAGKLGLSTAANTVFEGSAIDAMSSAELRQVVRRASVFARVEPRHKLKIVEALQANGEIVAMTGDGVNDAPALKKADIGVAVGSGTDVAKQTADLVLLDNRFSTIVEAVRLGRITYENIQKVMIYLLMDSLTEVTVVTGAILMGLPLPLLPVQILWIKMIEDTSPAMALAFEDQDDGVMNRPPRSAHAPLLSRGMLALIYGFAVIMNILLLGMFVYFYNNSGENLGYARTITFIGLGIGSLLYIYSVRSLHQSVLTLNPFSNKWLTLTTVLGSMLLLAAIYTPVCQQFLYTVPLGVFEWLVLLGYALCGLVVFELLKWKFVIHEHIPVREKLYE